MILRKISRLVANIADFTAWPAVRLLPSSHGPRGHLQDCHHHTVWHVWVTESSLWAPEGWEHLPEINGFHPWRATLLFHLCKSGGRGALSFFSISWSEFVSLFVHLTQPIKKNFKKSFLLIYFLVIFNIGFDGYYTVRTDEGQPRPKYIFNKHLYFFN